MQIVINYCSVSALTGINNYKHCHPTGNQSLIFQTWRGTPDPFWTLRDIDIASGSDCIWHAVGVHLVPWPCSGFLSKYKILSYLRIETSQNWSILNTLGYRYCELFQIHLTSLSYLNFQWEFTWYDGHGMEAKPS